MWTEGRTDTTSALCVHFIELKHTEFPPPTVKIRKHKHNNELHFFFNLHYYSVSKELHIKYIVGTSNPVNISLRLSVRLFVPHLDIDRYICRLQLG